MEQIKQDRLCYYCLGCNRLEDENFKGINRCQNFVPAVENWQEKLMKELKKNEL